MNPILTALPALASVTVHVDINWPRFVFSMLVLSGMLGYIVYAWLNR